MQVQCRQHAGLDERVAYAPWCVGRVALTGDREFGAPLALAWQADAVTTDLLERIIVDPAICFGKPTIRGHRLWVSLILGHLAEGWTVDAVLVELPQLEVDDVRACIAYDARLADVRFADLDAPG